MPNPHLCPLCNQPNNCKLIESADTPKTCWCMQIKIAQEILAKIPSAQANIACICHSCAFPGKSDAIVS